MQTGTESLSEIHPEVFSMVECWLSDTAQPVVTEINLDAVRRNGNQFNGKIFTDRGEWVRTNDEYGRGYMRYRVLSRQGNSYVVEFQNNGGGSLTTTTKIGFTLSHRTVEVEGKQKRVQIMRIESLQEIIQPIVGGDRVSLPPQR
jgi:hypothetical protein